MHNESSIEGRVEGHREIRKSARRVLILSLLVLISHVLDIEPSDFDAGGLKIQIDDLIVIQGSISIYFLFSVWELILNWILLHVIVNPLKPQKSIQHNFLNYAKRPYRDFESNKPKQRTPEQAKRWVRRAIIVFRFYTMPITTIIILLQMVAVFVAVGDSWHFFQFLWRQV